jgi:1,2-diacylglycerol 3-alpha-glucosyltransferase
LVLPSVSETWGLVVNEALAAGLPVLVSHRCGCVPELVRQGWNGYLCDPLDAGDMARWMAVLSSPAVDLEAMGTASRRIIDLYTPETWAHGLADCIEQTAVLKRGTVAEGRSRWAGFLKAEKQPS